MLSCARFAAISRSFADFELFKVRVIRKNGPTAAPTMRENATTDSIKVNPDFAAIFRFCLFLCAK